MTHFDVVTIFPAFFQVLDVSLLGKAQIAGTLSFGVHDLREWASGRHRSVDDTPYGGGAGMVMRPDVWGRALDAVLEQREGPAVLAVPTPAGEPLTQARVEELARSGRRLVIACGRYEGIDRRVIDHYAHRDGVEVFEFSLGDYVLNGGEVAALALIEAVGRLAEGVVGNPDSLVEESHGESGLLEYPAFTRPPTWRGLAVPDVLIGGNHVRVARWRRDVALALTADRRPDLLDRVSGDLDAADREALARAGHLVTPARREPLTLRPAAASDRDNLVALAQRLFPDACPPGLDAEAIRAHVETRLGPDTIGAMIARDVVWLAETREGLVGYAAIQGPPLEVGTMRLTARLEEARTLTLSKLYVTEEVRGAGVAHALTEAALRDACAHWPDASALVVGTSRVNKRALTHYRRAGFRKGGTRTFRVGGVTCDDLVLVRDLTATPPAPVLTDLPQPWNNGSGTLAPRDLPQGER